MPSNGHNHPLLTSQRLRKSGRSLVYEHRYLDVRPVSREPRPLRRHARLIRPRRHRSYPARTSHLLTDDEAGRTPRCVASYQQR